MIWVGGSGGLALGSSPPLRGASAVPERCGEMAFDAADAISLRLPNSLQ